MLFARITADPIDPQAEFRDFLAATSGDGAVVSFLGVARETTRDGVHVDRLFLDHHPTLSERSVRTIADAAGQRFAVSRITVVHRFGLLAPGETIVFVAAASTHRRAAFEACDYLMDGLKTEAVFWKREDTADGSRWIEPTPGDFADNVRWSA